MNDDLKLRYQTGFPVYLCAKELYNRFNELLLPYDLTYTQAIVMTYLWEVGESNVRDASNALLLDPSTLTPLLKRLEGKGYISRQRDGNDERILTVRPTEKGMMLKNDISGIPAEAKNMLGLSAEELSTLRSLITKALNNIERNKRNGSN